MKDKDSRASENFGQIAIALIVLLVGGALWKISRPSTTLASAGFSLESSQAWSFLIFCLGVAGLTMSLVQVCRMLYPFRGYFHREALEKWLTLGSELSIESFAVIRMNMEVAPGGGVTVAQQVVGDPNGAAYEAVRRVQYARLLTDWESVLKLLGLKEPSVEAALEELELQRGSKSLLKVELDLFPASMDLYDLPIEQLSGQLNLALETGLDDPRRFRNLIVLMVGKEGATDLLSVIQPLSNVPKFGEGQSTGGDDSSETKYSEQALAQAQSRAAITRMVQLRIDSFQIATGGQWRHRLRLVVLAVSFFLSFIVLFNSTPVGDAASGGLIVKLAKMPLQSAYSLVVGAIGGYLAMFLRDLTVIVENKRRRA
jgi:hypothetical protein